MSSALKLLERKNFLKVKKKTKPKSKETPRIKPPCFVSLKQCLRNPLTKKTGNRNFCLGLVCFPFISWMIEGCELSMRLLSHSQLLKGWGALSGHWPRRRASSSNACFIPAVWKAGPLETQPSSPPTLCRRAKSPSMYYLLHVYGNYYFCHLQCHFN